MKVIGYYHYHSLPCLTIPIWIYHPHDDDLPMTNAPMTAAFHATSDSWIQHRRVLEPGVELLTREHLEESPSWCSAITSCCAKLFGA